MAKSILMVCLGNICRSPLAEGIMSAKLEHTDHYVDSAGTSSHHQGELPDHRSIATAHKYAIDISDQRSRPFQMTDFDTFDYILVMDKSNLRNVLSLARTPEDEQKVSIIMDAIEGRVPNEVPDPYYGGDHGFENVYHMLDEACDAFIKQHNL